MINRIRKYVSHAELLALLGEEASELTQAALKYRRTLPEVSKQNPTSQTPIEAYNHLLEEIADVNLAIKALGIVETDLCLEKIEKIMAEKEKRWLQRLEGERKEDDDDRLNRWLERMETKEEEGND